MFVINFVINRAEKNIREDKKKDWVFNWLPILTLVILDILYEHLKGNEYLKDKIRTLRNYGNV